MIYIFIVETNSKNKSDEMYIRSLLDQRYDYLGDKLKFIYMDGKGNYSKKESEVQKWLNKYSGKSAVFMCIDLDNDMSQVNNSTLNNEITSYCKKKGFELIWFNENIEQVFLGESVESSSKGKEAKKFYTSNKIEKIDSIKLKQKIALSKKTSNIQAVLDKYMKLKI